MLFYSLDLWEHTLAMMFSTAAVYWFVVATSQEGLSRFALAGVALGAAGALREEMLCFVPALLIGLAWVDRRRRLPARKTRGTIAQRDG